jgi:hypothetical protein
MVAFRKVCRWLRSSLAASFLVAAEYQPSMQRSAEPMDEAINQANQANLVTEWILITVFLIVPAMILLIALPVAIVKQRGLKCPKCGNWRKNKVAGMQTTKNVEGSKTKLTTQRLIACRKCKHEFTV